MRVMLPKVAVIALFFGSAHPALTQESDIGIYMVVKFERNCSHQLLTSDRKRVCLAPEPIIRFADFSYITNIIVDRNNRPYFNIVFTEQGKKKLRSLATAFPNSQLALVVDGTIIGFLKNLDRLSSNALRMEGGDAGSRLPLDAVHGKLKKILTVK